jgi:uncharacterized protein YigA (DUF484 family)
MKNNENIDDTAAQEAAFVDDYLLQNPEFFLHNPSLLTELRIPHESGSAVSLVERQVGLFRDKCQNLESHLNDLVDVAKENEILNQKVHTLACDIISCSSLKSLEVKLAQSLEEGFGADRMAFHFIDRGIDLGESAYTYEPGEFQIVRDSMQGADIVCGRLTDLQKSGLFGTEADDVRSAALIWLAPQEDLGLMVLGSTDPEHFTAEKGVVFLEQIRNLVAHKVDALIR